MLRSTPAVSFSYTLQLRRVPAELDNMIHLLHLLSVAVETIALIPSEPPILITWRPFFSQHNQFLEIKSLFLLLLLCFCRSFITSLNFPKEMWILLVDKNRDPRTWLYVRINCNLKLLIPTYQPINHIQLLRHVA